MKLQADVIYELKNGMKRTIWTTDSGKFFLLIIGIGIIKFNDDGTVVDPKYKEYEIKTEETVKKEKVNFEGLMEFFEND